MFDDKFVVVEAYVQSILSYTTNNKVEFAYKNWLVMFRIWQWAHLTQIHWVSSHQRIFQHIQHLSRFWHALFLRTSLDGLAIGDRRFFLVRRLHLDCNVFFFHSFFMIEVFLDSNLAMWYHTSWVFPTTNQIFLFTRTTRSGHLRRVPMLTNKIKLRSFLLN